MVFELHNKDPRADWFYIMAKIVTPVMEFGAQDQLKRNIPQYTPVDSKGNLPSVAHFEAAARTLAGIAPWLELRDIPSNEVDLQNTYRHAARSMLRSLFDKNALDYVWIQSNPQCLVELAHIVLALLRAPTQLWSLLEEQTRKNIFTALILSRDIKPFLNNWILFSGLIEAFLHYRFGNGDLKKTYVILQKVNSWYVGDGCYKDGKTFHFDYYNSIAIHPMLLNIMNLLPQNTNLEIFRNTIFKRAKRYGLILERMISPEGAMPPVGRSLTYRTGTLHLLAELALNNMLPNSLRPENVQLAMSTVISRYFGHADSWDKDGWLNVGAVGQQEGLAEFYISRGSLYMALMAFLPLGLSGDHNFWRVGETFTSQTLYAGTDLSADRFLD